MNYQLLITNYKLNPSLEGRWRAEGVTEGWLRRLANIAALVSADRSTLQSLLVTASLMGSN